MSITKETELIGMKKASEAVAWYPTVQVPIAIEYNER
jgi:hypothetical protein